MSDKEEEIKEETKKNVYNVKNLSDCPQLLRRSSLVEYNKKLYLFGGYNHNPDKTFKSLYVYDPEKKYKIIFNKVNGIKLKQKELFIEVMDTQQLFTRMKCMCLGKINKII
jgi:N-acetylneuraminic acid mutarotase